MRKNENYLVFDTETAGSLGSPLVYDFGFIVIDRQGNEKLKDCFVISDVFYDNNLMNNCFFKNKIPQYKTDIANGNKKVINFFLLKSYMKKVCELYNIKKVYAYNMAFDKKALENTTKTYIYDNAIQFFDNVEYYCIYTMACNMILNNRNYRKFCINNGYLTEKGNIKTSAEIVHRYLTGDLTFNESHTSLDDSKIEKNILVKCWNTHKKMIREPNSACWKIPQLK